MKVKSGSPVGLASVGDAVPPHPLRRLSHGDDDLPPWHHRPHKRARSLDDVPSLDEGDAIRRRSLWSARRSRISRVTPSAVVQVWYLQAMAAWTSTNSYNMSRTTLLLTVVDAGSCCTATTKDELGCQSPHPSDACLDATAVGLAEGLINREDLLRTRPVSRPSHIPVSSEDDFDG